MNKEDVVYTHTHTHTHSVIILSHKKNETVPFAATLTDPENVIVNEVRKTSTI